MKLSEPEKRVLRTMLEYDCVIIASWANTDGQYEGVKVPTIPRPRWNTLNSLRYDRELLSCEWTVCHLTYHLTPKGREKAKELQDVQD